MAEHWWLTDIVIHHSFPLGEIIIAIAAIVAAAVAAYTAVKLNRQELEHDRALQSEALAHDRSMRGRDNLRTILGGVASDLVRLTDLATNAAIAVNDIKDDDPKTHATALEAVVALADQQSKVLLTNNALLLIWLSPDDPIYVTHRNAEKGIREWTTAVGDAARRGKSLTEDQRNELQEKDAASAEPHRLFIEAVRSWASQ